MRVAVTWTVGIVTVTLSALPVDVVCVWVPSVICQALFSLLIVQFPPSENDQMSDFTPNPGWISWRR